MSAARRALVVEDEAVVAILLEDMLVELGFEVAGVAGSLERGLAMACEIDCELAVLDINLGGEARSFAIADRLGERGIPFLFVTGYGRSGLEGRYAHAPVVNKPLWAPALRDAIERAMG